LPSAPPAQLETAHPARHDDIGQHQIDRRILLDQGQCGMAVFRLDSRIADVPQYLDRHTGNVGLAGNDPALFCLDQLDRLLEVGRRGVRVVDRRDVGANVHCDDVGACSADPGQRFEHGGALARAPSRDGAGRARARVRPARLGAPRTRRGRAHAEAHAPIDAGGSLGSLLRLQKH